MGKKQFQPEAEKSLSEILQIRRDKLANLQENGREPFYNHKYDSHRLRCRCDRPL